jgi:ABC-type branched-subunit amino acid transport system substrate-binding protein
MLIHLLAQNEPSCLDSVAEITKGQIRSSVDCISNTQSAAVCAAAMKSSGGIYISCTSSGPIIDNPRVKTIKIVAFTVLGREFAFGAKGPQLPVIEEDQVFGADFALKIEELLAAKRIQPVQAEVRAGGLQGILSGLDDLKAGKVHSKRLVHRVS